MPNGSNKFFKLCKIKAISRAFIKGGTTDFIKLLSLQPVILITIIQKPIVEKSVLIKTAMATPDIPFFIAKG